MEFNIQMLAFRCNTCNAPCGKVAVGVTSRYEMHFAFACHKCSMTTSVLIPIEELYKAVPPHPVSGLTVTTDDQKLLAQMHISLEDKCDSAS